MWTNDARHTGAITTTVQVCSALHGLLSIALIGPLDHGGGAGPLLDLSGASAAGVRRVVGGVRVAAPLGWVDIFGIGQSINRTQCAVVGGVVGVQLLVERADVDLVELLLLVGVVLLQGLALDGARVDEGGRRGLFGTMITRQQNDRNDQLALKCIFMYSA